MPEQEAYWPKQHWKPKLKSQQFSNAKFKKDLKIAGLRNPKGRCINEASVGPQFLVTPPDRTRTATRLDKNQINNHYHIKTVNKHM